MDNERLLKIKNILNERLVEKKKSKSLEKATELEYLKWFYQNVDFGPAHGDVIYCLNERFKKKTGKILPDGYDYDEDIN